jgi:proline dehydrogenase
MRKLLLWCAQNKWLAEHVPQWPFARRAVKRFMPGEGFDSAQAAAEKLKSQGVGTLFTLLGENVVGGEGAAGVVKHYEEILPAVRALGAEVSVKPTHLGLDVDPDAAYANLLRLARAAAAAKTFLWIDMEGSAYVDRTLELYTRVRREVPSVGIAIQAYLKRTVADVSALLKENTAIRLVKGAYSEPPAIAYTAKREVDANYLALTVFMLPDVKRGNLRLVLGSHDVDLLRTAWRYAEALSVQRERFEIAMLYGIRMDEQLRLAREGFPVRCLISYGDAWYAWYLRRLAERPANLLFAARQLLP